MDVQKDEALDLEMKAQAAREKPVRPQIEKKQQVLELATPEVLNNETTNVTLPLKNRAAFD
jgi:hypothetical protein